MQKWVKLFEVEGQQVLFYLEPDGDDSWLHQCVHTDGGLHVDVKLIFRNDTKENDRKVFDAIDEGSAARVLKMVRDMLADRALEDTAEDAEASVVAEDEEESAA